MMHSYTEALIYHSYNVVIAQFLTHKKPHTEHFLALAI